jgi:hypothetical protein
MSSVPKHVVLSRYPSADEPTAFTRLRAWAAGLTERRTVRARVRKDQIRRQLDLATRL